jgi:hypothetical protein
MGMYIYDIYVRVSTGEGTVARARVGACVHQPQQIPTPQQVAGGQLFGSILILHRAADSSRHLLEYLG